MSVSLYGIVIKYIQLLVVGVACSLFVRISIYLGLICLDNILLKVMMKYGRWSDILPMIIPDAAVFVVAESVKYI